MVCPDDTATQPDSKLPGGRSKYFFLAIGLSGLIIGFFLWANSTYLFHTKLYESADPGANSLSVFRAEHFHELYGAYSRWNFHHPGPALFYSLALGEALFYRTLRLVPTPYNAQVIMTLILSSGFFAGGVTVAARWIRSGLFVPLALLFGALHWTAVQTQRCVTYPWPAFVLTLPFFALLTAAASVAAGQGDDLPLLMLAGGFALHSHVAQPLFVGPIFLLAYTGLTRACHRQRPVTSPIKNNTDSHRAEVLTARPWRLFARAHRLAMVIAAAFALPMIVDLFFGQRSNLVKILSHIHTHRGESHPWLDALNCFLRFGIYKPSTSFDGISPGHVTWTQIGHLLSGHPEMASLWLGALAIPLVALALNRLPTVRSLVEPTATPVTSAAHLLGQTRRWRWRFLGWLAVFSLLSAGLTVCWGHLQDGELFYYNSWFNYAIYFVLALLAAGALCDIMETISRRGRFPEMPTAVVAALCVIATVGFVSRQPARYREHQFDDPADRAAADAVAQVLREHPNESRTKLLLFPQLGWEAATGVANLLTREGYPCLVPPEWWCMFGTGYIADNLLTAIAPKPHGAASTAIWRIVPGGNIDPVVAARYPHLRDCILLPDNSSIDPASSDSAITFAYGHSNAFAYVVDGWSAPDPGSPDAWSVGKRALLSFVPKPVPPNTPVEMAFYFAQIYPAADKRVAQRLRLRFNDHAVGEFRLDTRSLSPLKIFIPAEYWNEREVAVCVLGFPDANSPLESGESNDERLLAFRTSKISFHVTDTPVAPVPP